MDRYTIGWCLLLLGALPAFAKSPSATWHADLQETAADGTPIVTLVGVKQELTLFELNEKPIRFEFSDTNLATQQTTKMNFQITGKRSLGCGSIQWTAMSSAYRRSRITLTVADHRRRTCDDLKKAVWEVSMASGKAKRYFLGSPKLTTQFPSCEKISGNFQQVCILLYAPVTCTISQFDGKPLQPPITVTGSNSCFAEGAAESALCARGLDPDRMRPEDFICNITMPPVCALPMCAAPPEGCTMTSSSELDANGCPKYPCGILSCNP